MEFPEPELLSYVSVLKDSELLYERGIYPQLTYVFKHALTQDVAYNSLLLKRSKEIHQEIGKLIEHTYPERLEEFCETLAYHYTMCDNYEKACPCLKLSGNKAWQKYSLSEAFHFYREAINLNRKLPETNDNLKEQIEVRLLITNPMHLLGHPGDSLQILQESVRLAKEIGDQRSLITFQSKLGSYYAAHAEPLLAVKYAESAFQEADKIQDIELVAPMACELSNAYLAATEFSKTVHVGTKVLALLEKTQRERDFFNSRYNVFSGISAYCGYALGILGDFEKGKIVLEKGIHFAQEVQSVYGLGFLELCHGMLLNTMGDGKTAVDRLQESIRYLEQSQTVYMLGLAGASLGYGYYLLGELETAKNFIEKGVKIQNEEQQTVLLVKHILNLGIVHFDLGDAQNAKSRIEEALSISREENKKLWEAYSRIWLGRILGKPEKASIGKGEEHILQGIKICDEMKAKPFAAKGYLFLGELYADNGQGEKALENLQRAEKMFKEMEMDYWLGKTKKILERL
jgi:tetratricopeptide (TPR) repeat protein